MGVDEIFDRPQLTIVEAGIVRQFDGGLKPELGFAISARDVNMRTGLFA
jgi:hypothetical protein